ncbi:MAG: glycoside hydrolase family 113 [Planctomycetota bacterium]|jgi:hypothetical protein
MSGRLHPDPGPGRGSAGGRRRRRAALALGTLVLAALAAAARPADRPPALVDTRPVLGFAINAHHIGDLPRYLRSVDAIADLGANALIIVTPMYQSRVDSVEIAMRPDKCPTDEQLLAILERARRRDLLTMLLPIVLIESPEDKEWRGVIRPRDWETWWRSYEAFLDRFVDLAVTADVDILSIGSELNRTEDQVGRWRSVIERVRGRYDGLLTYSANWDRYDRTRLWSLVDVISVSAYFEIGRDDPAAPVETLAAAWTRERDRLLRFAGRHGRPLLLSEVGYPSLPWAGAHPWNYVAGGETPADPEAQARCYRAFFRAWAPVLGRPDGTAAGFFCYRWDPYHRGGPRDTGYGVVGKPALEVIRDGFERLKAAPANADD